MAPRNKYSVIDNAHCMDILFKIFHFFVFQITANKKIRRLKKENLEKMLTMDHFIQFVNVCVIVCVRVCLLISGPKRNMEKNCRRQSTNRKKETWKDKQSKQSKQTGKTNKTQTQTQTQT